MTLSISSSAKVVTLLVAIFVGLLGCANKNGSVVDPIEVPLAQEKKPLIAVLPFYNLSAAPAPLKDLRQSLMTTLSRQGLNLLDEVALENFMMRRRLRHVGGIDRLTALTFRKEVGVEAVLITAVELYDETFPPKIAITSRMVSTGDSPEILWIDGLGWAGDDSPGILGLSLIEDPQNLVERALLHLSTSLTGYLAGKRAGLERHGRKKFRPKISYRSPVLTPGIRYTGAVLPFINRSERKRAGEVMGLHFVKHLKALDNVRVIEPGVVRDVLLELRVIMEDGVSLRDASAVFQRLGADLLFTGKIFEYEDYQGPIGEPKVDFSAQVIQRESREVVWVSKSSNKGRDRVFFFDWGKVNTAQAMASEMVDAVVAGIFE